MKNRIYSDLAIDQKDLSVLLDGDAADFIAGLISALKDMPILTVKYVDADTPIEIVKCSIEYVDALTRNKSIEDGKQRVTPWRIGKNTLKYKDTDIITICPDAIYSGKDADGNLVVTLDLDVIPAGEYLMPLDSVLTYRSKTLDSLFAAILQQRGLSFLYGTVVSRVHYIGERYSYSVTESPEMRRIYSAVVYGEMTPEVGLAAISNIEDDPGYFRGNNRVTNVLSVQSNNELMPLRRFLQLLVSYGARFDKHAISTTMGKGQWLKVPLYNLNQI